MGEELGAQVHALIAVGVRENSALDYKRDMYPATEGGRKEFAKDLSAFANRDGGLLVIGLAEEDGAPSEVLGIPAGEVDAAILWLESVARSGVTPHLPGLVIKQIDHGGASLIAVSVPRGLDQPYEVASAGQRFFVRDERSVRAMSREELKFAASRSASLAERVDAFVQERFDAFLGRMDRDQTLG